MKLDVLQPGAGLVRASLNNLKGEPSQDLCAKSSMVLQALHSQQAVRVLSQGVSRQVGGKHRGMHCFVLKPK